MTTEYVNSALAEIDSSGRIADGLLASEAQQKVLTGSDLTFTRVKIDAAARMTLAAGVTGKTQRLHGLVLVAAAAATVTIAYDDDGAATNAVALTGAMSLAESGVLVIPFDANPAACLAGAVGKFLTLTPSAAVDGYAIVSTD